ncbi:GIY-YIG nuclease family protein [Candidatus Nomurabacteria bacterium]|nr:GIY-YIG nuclease family protein [Candidatus Nomurabacteria bacterium]
MKNLDLKKNKIPDKSGVYFFMGGKKILYIGKATSLKDRVKSYFPSTTLGAGRLLDSRGPLITDMVTKATNIKWQETDSVLEALILETNLIKKHQPYYNTKEKDDKSFNYVCITKEELPKVLIVRGRDLQKKKKNSPAFALGDIGQGTHGSLNSSVSFSSVFGPFPNGGQLKEALKIIRRIFPFLDEKSKNHYEFYKQINLVPEKKDLLLKNIKNIKLFFEGKKKSILKNLEKEMNVYAKNHEFEKAGEIKRQIFALKHINDISLIKNLPEKNFPAFALGDIGQGTHGSLNSSLFNSFRIEAYDIAHMSGKNMVGVMVVLENGEVNKNQYRKFLIKNYTSSNDTGALSEVLSRRLKHAEWQYPDLIVVDGGTAQRNVALKILKEFNLKIPVSAVVKDEKHKAKMILSADSKFKKAILLANSEAHRFAIKYHKIKRNKAFLG